MESIATGAEESTAPTEAAPTPSPLPKAETRPANLKSGPSNQPPAEAVAGLARFGIGGAPPPPPRRPAARPGTGAKAAAGGGGSKGQASHRSPTAATHRDDISPDNTLVDVDVVSDVSAEAEMFKPWWFREGGLKKAVVAAGILVAILSTVVLVAHLLHWPPPADANAEAVDPAALLGGAASSGPASPNPDSETKSDSEPASSSAGTDSASVPQKAAAPDDSRSAAATPPATSAAPAPNGDDGMARPAGPNSIPPIQPSRRPVARRAQP
jgi:hypothetical protein